MKRVSKTLLDEGYILIMRRKNSGKEVRLGLYKDKLSCYRAYELLTNNDEYEYEFVSIVHSVDVFNEARKKMAQ